FFALCPRRYLYGLLYAPTCDKCSSLCAQPSYGLVDHGGHCVRACLCDERIHLLVDGRLWQLLRRFICLGARPQMAFACQQQVSSAHRSANRVAALLPDHGGVCQSILWLAEESLHLCHYPCKC